MAFRLSRISLTMALGAGLLVLAGGLCAATPGAGTAVHKVVKGDTLTAISRRYGLSVAEVKRLNGLKGDMIQLGQTLRVGGATSEGAGVPKALPVQEDGTPAKPTAVKLRGLSTEDRFRVHLYLDRELFAPGKVDGMIGEFTDKAVLRWRLAKKGRTEQELIQTARLEIPYTMAEATVPEAAGRFVGEMPKTVEEKGKLSLLPYTSMLEFMAERYHTDEATLVKLNPTLNLASLKPGSKLKVPAARAFQIEQWAGNGAGGRKGDMLIRVKHRDRMLEVWNGAGGLVAAFPITVGTKPEYVRKGLWKISSVAPHPTFLWDDDMLKRGVKGEKRTMLPPGPNNPVGVMWLGLTPESGAASNIGIHGTDSPARIGRNHSSGCIRLANWDVVRLATLVARDTQVVWENEAIPVLQVAGR